MAPLLSSLNTYLYNRQQVKLNSPLSVVFNVTSGVPQGSHLGPLLFSLFINDLIDSLSSSTLLFADDMKLYRQINSSQDLIILQIDLNTIFNWCLRNNMYLNIAKCYFMRFSRLIKPVPAQYHINNTDLSQVSVIKDLGVYLDNKLTFTEHCNIVIDRANRMLGFIKRGSRDFKNIFAVKTLYTSLVRPILEFSNIIWSLLGGTCIPP